MAGSKVSELVELNTVSGQEAIPVVYQGQNFRVPVSKLKQGLGLAKSDVGLGRVDNTADLEKPVSLAQQQALDKKAEAIHTHAIADVKDLQSALDSKADASTVATKQDLVNIETEVSGKANAVHSHSIADVAGLTTQLDAVSTRFGEVTAEANALGQKVDTKADIIHQHVIADVSGLSDALAVRPTTEVMSGALLGKSDIGHTHSVNDITGLSEIITQPTVVFTEEDW